MWTALEGVKPLFLADRFTCEEQVPVMLEAWMAGPLVAPPINLWISHPTS